MWEERDQAECFTYSGVMVWLTLDLAIGSIEHHGMDGPLEQWKTFRDEIRTDLIEHGFNRPLDSFVAYRGSQLLDASVLLLPVVGFLPADDPRMIGTVKALEKGCSKMASCCATCPRRARPNRAPFSPAASGWLRFTLEWTHDRCAYPF
jgi:GH15 family glucan-1,4-alpha-glucosidase